MKIKVKNMTSQRTGNDVANQFEIETPKYIIFQSYDSIIAKRDRIHGKVTLDAFCWDYSRTTLKYLKDFLGVNISKKEIQSYIDQGLYKIKNLNK